VRLHHKDGTNVRQLLYQKFGKSNFPNTHVIDAEDFGVCARANFNKAEYSSTLLPENIDAHQFWLQNIRKTKSSSAVPATVTGHSCLNNEAGKLAALINQYRVSQGLAKIPVSRKLSKVAQLHVEDLRLNRPDRSPGCNSHSWSAKAMAKPCCYTEDHAQGSCMWSKPRELANYNGPGYEIAFGPYGNINAENSMAAWKKSPGHESVIVNHGIWRNQKWNAMGVGINGEYAVVWFGVLKDTEECP
jgi:uncharacterized protein YkwD